MTEKNVRVPAFVATAMLASLLCLLPTTLAAAARAPEPLAEVGADAGLVTFQPLISHSQVRVTVTGPEGFEVVKTFGADEVPAVELPGTDGLYKYELRFAPVLDREARKLLAAARAAGTDLGGDKEADKRTVQRGWFSLAGGSVVPDLAEPEPKVVLTNGDGVIRNSLCVGFDCPDAPVFSDSTILLMENNTRIKFGDTSNAPFPNNDWEIEANSSLSGGANYLGFNDCGSADNDGGCATDLVFAVESGARASALYVESDGDIGIGTSNPVVDIHVVTGNTPALRLDQDGSAGFAPQVWDVAGNETNFFVRDVTNGSSLPFRIQPSAPSNSIFVTSNGDVGLGTASPAGALHVRRAGNVLPIFESSDGNAVQFRIKSESTNRRIIALDGSDNQESQIVLQDNGAFQFLGPTAGDVRMSIASNGNMTIQGGLITTGGGGACTVGDPCDGVFHPDFEVPTIEEHAALMWQNSFLPAVGPTSESGPINITQKVGGILNELEKAHIYIEQLHQRLEEEQQQRQALDQRLQHLEELLARSAR